MAESDTILQLGIEAAREGNRDEARSLFSLLTRQEPDNVQAWLWLAGVAESPAERRAALERVVALDPNNEMARKSLQSMTGETTADGPVSSAPVVAPVIAPMVEGPTYAPEPAAMPIDDEQQYASELDSAFDDYDAVEKVGPVMRNTPTDYEDAAGETAAGSYAGSSARSRVDSRRSTRGRTLVDDDDVLPPRRGPSSLALIIGGIIAAFVIGFLLWQFVFNRDTNVATGPVTSQTTDAGGGGGLGGNDGLTGTSTAGAPDGGVLVPTPSDGSGTTGVGGTDIVTSTDGVTTTDGVTPPAPTDATPPAPDVPAAANPDPATASPQVVGIGTQVSAAGWNYTYPNATYSALLGGTVGDQTAANGRFVVVLAFVANTTGTAQTIPADFFVLKDAQGRVYSTNAAASRIYTQPGINADKSLEDQLPVDGLSYSVALVFDVAPGATDLVLFARPNQSQGFQVLNTVP